MVRAELTKYIHDAVAKVSIYGEVESEHQYQYHESGALKHAQITEDDEVRDIYFNESGEMV